MINATKSEVDEAKKNLADDLAALAYTIRDWQAHPGSETQLKAARTALDNAEATFAEYVHTLETWAAGPSGEQR